VDGFLTARQYGKVQKIAANSINRRHFEQLACCAKLPVFLGLFPFQTWPRRSQILCAARRKERNLLLQMNDAQHSGAQNLARPFGLRSKSRHTALQPLPRE